MLRSAIKVTLFVQMLLVYELEIKGGGQKDNAEQYGHVKSYRIRGYSAHLALQLQSIFVNLGDMRTAKVPQSTFSTKLCFSIKRADFE